MMLWFEGGFDVDVFSILLFEGEWFLLQLFLYLFPVLIMGEFVWVLDVDVGVLLVLLFEGEWFLLLWVVVFISFSCAG